MKITGTDGKKYTIRSRANLRDTNLSDANLRGASLQIDSENPHMHSPTITN